MAALQMDQLVLPASDHAMLALAMVVLTAQYLVIMLLQPLLRRLLNFISAAPLGGFLSR